MSVPFSRALMISDLSHVCVCQQPVWEVTCSFSQSLWHTESDQFRAFTAQTVTPGVRKHLYNFLSAIFLLILVPWNFLFLILQPESGITLLYYALLLCPYLKPSSGGQSNVGGFHILRAIALSNGEEGALPSEFWLLQTDIAPAVGTTTELLETAYRKTVKSQREKSKKSILHARVS